MHLQSTVHTSCAPVVCHIVPLQLVIAHNRLCGYAQDDEITHMSDMWICASFKSGFRCKHVTEIGRNSLTRLILFIDRRRYLIPWNEVFFSLMTRID